MNKYYAAQSGGQEKTAVNVQCKNKIDGCSGEFSKEQTLLISYRPLQHVGNRGLN